MIGWWGPGSPKEQFLRRLHRRVGHPFFLSFDEPFRFDAAGQRWRNIDQLEAVVEFYVNFTEPWGGAAHPPVKPGDAGYREVSLRDPTGEDARIEAAASWVHLDGDPDLRDVIPNPAANPPQPGPAVAGYPPRLKFLYDTLWLASDRGRTSRAYRIMEVDNGAKRVRLDARPNCPDDRSKWTLRRCPIIVIVDPLGPRARGNVTLAGNAATVTGADPADATKTLVHLDGGQSLSRINAGFDTIHLPADTAPSPDRPGPVYRIARVDEAARNVAVVGAPSFEGGSSRWEIPAGVSGLPPTLDYNIGPHLAPPPVDPDLAGRGFDHYDGGLFIVHRSGVRGARLYRWTTYTSRVYGTWSGANWREELSSVRGNARYCYSAYRSTDDFKNFTLAIVDTDADVAHGLRPPLPHDIFHVDAADHVAQARYYFGTPTPAVPPQPNPDALDPRVTADANGKTLIRLHQGNKGARLGSGSAGCNVSPLYVDMRTDLVELYESDYEEYYGPGARDDQVHKLRTHGATLAASKVLWSLGEAVPNGLSHANYDDKLAGALWLIRPDERPLSP